MSASQVVSLCTEHLVDVDILPWRESPGPFPERRSVGRSGFAQHPWAAVPGVWSPGGRLLGLLCFVQRLAEAPRCITQSLNSGLPIHWSAGSYATQSLRGFLLPSSYPVSQPWLKLILISEMAVVAYFLIITVSCSH